MPSEKAKMLNGELYDASDPVLVTEREAARELTRRYNETSAGETAHREQLVEELFGTVEGACEIEPPFHCDYGYNVHVGESFYANFGCVFLDVCEVRFGDHCLLGPSVHVYTATHPLDPDERRKGLEYGKPVTVGDNVWIGGQAVLNPGVTVGDDAVIGSGAVVTEDVPAGVVVQGNPATVVKTLD